MCVREAEEKTVVAGGIFDGHGIHGSQSWGQDIAEAASRAICQGAAEWGLDDAANDDSSKLAVVFEEFQRRHEAHYDKQITTTVDLERQKFQEANGFSPGPRTLPAEGGTTATVVVVHGDSLHAAWVGDSRAVLCREEEAEDGKGALSAVALTLDHNVAGNAAERGRCETAGGMILGKFVGSSCADGMLQVTRSLGDRAHHEANVVLSTPETLSLRITDDDAFVVVASDGIWENLPQKDVVKLIHDAIAAAPPNCASKQKKALEDGVCRVLDKVHDAVRQQGLKSDDCSLLVLVLDRVKPYLKYKEAPIRGGSIAPRLRPLVSAVAKPAPDEAHSTAGVSDVPHR